MTRNKIYQGTSKTLFQTDDEEHALVMAFNDKVKLKNGAVIEVPGKGVINNNVSSFIMSKLDMIGIDNHFIEKINMREQLIQFVDIFPLQLSISSVACERYVTEFGMEEGYVFDSPIIDFRIKNSELKYPAINEHQAINFGWMNKYEVKELKYKAIRVYDFLTGMYAAIGIRLVEARLEFGRVFDGENFIVMLVDEIGFDNCRLWDMNSNEKMSFELLEQDPEKAVASYQIMMARLGISG